jgi:outer membrane protein assembly factor BamB
MVDWHKQEKWLRYTAYVALGFAALMSVLVILNYLQLNRIDPVNTEVINDLVVRLQDNPSDQQLREQIRELDLLARKAYFTNRWQVRYGAYIILISLSLFVIIYQLLLSGKRQQVIANPDAPRDVLGINQSARRGIAFVGILLVLSALFLAYRSHQQLPDPMKEKRSYVAQESAEMDDKQEQPVQIMEDSLASDREDAGAKVEIKDSSMVEEERVPENKVAEDEVPEEKASEEELVEKNATVRPFPTTEELRKNAASFRGHNGNAKIYQADVPVKWNGNNGENILWKVSVPIQSYNSPIVWEDKIFLTGANESSREVYCYRKNDGQLIWTKKVTGIPGSPAKAPKTTKDTGLGASTMTTDGRRVYAIFGTGDLISLDMDGNVVWAKNLGVPQNHYGHASSLIMHQQKLIVQYDQKKNGSIMAFDAETGDQIWKTPRKEKISWASPILVYHKNKSQIVVVADPTVAAYDPWTGKELWSIECISGEVGPSACYDDGVVFAVNEYANVAAIDLDDPSKLLWENSDVLSDIPSPLAANGLLIMPTSYGALACYDAKEGEILWEHEFDEGIYSSPLLVGNLVYVMDTAGNTHIFRLSREAYQEISVNPLGEDAVTTPAIADGRIYIRTDKHLYCIGK